MRYLLISIFMIFILLACQESSNITEPLEGITSQTLTKDSESCNELITLPPKAPEWQDSIFSVSKEIDGAIGGFIYLNKYYIDANGNKIDIKARLTIPTFAFQGIEIITITVDNDYAALHFSPAITFTKNLKLYTYFSGINLNGTDIKNLDFVYMADDGSIEILKKKGIKIFPKWGILQVNSVELPHFSRFGWIRKNVSGN